MNGESLTSTTSPPSYPEDDVPGCQVPDVPQKELMVAPPATVFIVQQQAATFSLIFSCQSTDHSVPVPAYADILYNG